MKRASSVFCVLAVLGALAVAQSSNPASGPELERVLDSMDRASADFRSGQAEFVWEQFQKVVNETEVQKGSIFFRRQGKDVEMAADINEPDKKNVLFTDGKVRVYQPKIDQVTEYSAGKNKQDFESFLVLGFGARGHDLSKGFEVTYQGSEPIQGKSAAKLLLVPKSDRVKGMFDRIFLWIDPARGVSLQQQFLEPSGDYRLSRYMNIKINPSLGGDVFKLKTTGKTKVVRPQG